MAGLNRAYKRRGNAVALNGAPILCLDAGSKVSYPGTGTAWTDLSGNANNGTLVNGPTFDSANGGSLVFNGTNQYVNTTYNSIYDFSDANFTVDCIALKTASGTTGILVQRATYGGAGTRSFEFYFSSTLTIHFGVYNGSWAYVDTSALQANTYYYIAATSDGAGNGKIYVNGTLLASNSSFKTSMTVTNIPVQIGAYSSGSYFGGKIPLCRLYNRALSATEVATNFELLRGRYGI